MINFVANILELSSLRYIFFLFSILTLMSSCEEDFIIERRDFQPKLVVNAIFKPGENWKVHISSSRDILVKDSEIQDIENAEVTIKEKSTGRISILKHTENGNYTSNIYPPEKDKTYEIIVEAEGYTKVTASSKAPKNANVVNIISDVVDKNVTKINFEIKDNTNNYLIWNFISSNINNPLDSSFTGNPKNLVTGIIKYNNISRYLGSLTDTENNIVIQEGTITGNVKTDGNGSGVQNPDGPASTIETKKYLRMLTTSVDLYNYYKSVEKFIASDNHNSSFSNAPQIYSNIKNGLGIFAGYTEEYKEIK